MLWRDRRHGRRAAVKGLVSLAVVLFLLHLFGLVNIWDFSSRRFDTWAWTPCPDSSPFQKSCKASRAEIAQDVQVVLRTGGSEPQNRIRSHLATVLSQVPSRNLLILSDLEEEIDSHHVYDVYADISARERGRYPEFTLYDAQQLYKQQGKDTRELEGGWTLGKYMNLPMKRKIWKMQQEMDVGEQARKKWFVFIETDTFVEWGNLFALLEHLDPKKKVYIGSPVWLPDVPFAHGGSAYVLSYAALKALNTPDLHDQGDIFQSQFGVNTSALCCGDEALARALKPRGVKLSGYWPMFNGELPTTLAFGRDLWCEPVISLHHISGEHLESLWKWVEGWRERTENMRPLLFEDLFGYILPQLSNMQVDWDNIDDDWKLYPKSKLYNTSFDKCKMACEMDKLCFQFVFHGDTCAISYHIRLGRKRSPDKKGGAQYISGWNMERIQDWTTKSECSSAHWLKSNP